MTTAYTELQHRWGEPLPGQGKQRICKGCGARESTAPKSCSGERGDVLHLNTVSDYEPFG